MAKQTITFQFSRPKMIESILYIANRIIDPTYFHISELLYLADKLSLENYGRLITGDTYFTVERGPLPSNTYALLEETARQTTDLDFRIRADRVVIALREPRLDELSDSDIESLDTTLNLYGHMPSSQRREHTHDNAWRTVWEHRADNNHTRIPIEAIAILLKDGSRLIEHLQNPCD